MMPVLTHIEFQALDLSHKFGLVVYVRGDAPPGPARSHNPSVRKTFWDQGKRLQMGGLVALVHKELGVPASSVDHHGSSGIEFGLAFVDPADGFRAAEVLRRREESRSSTRLLLESPVLYEAVRPFLQVLKTTDPLRLPLAEYIKHGDLKDKHIQLPAYSAIPGFKWDLSCMLKDGSEETCSMDPTSQVSIATAREILHEQGKLDRSQTDAVLDCLVREIALIQGPPGTGKTFTGVELLRLLFHNNVGPVVLLAFTNHALDHILRAAHDSGVTKDMLRLGSRSKDEVVSQYSLETLEHTQRKTSLHTEKSKFTGQMKDLEAQMKRVSENITRSDATEEQIRHYLQQDHPALFASINNPPAYVRALYINSADLDGWSTAGRKRTSQSLWAFWQAGLDLDHLRTLNAPPAKKTFDNKPIPTNRFDELSVADSTSEPSESEAIVPQSEEDARWSFFYTPPDVEHWDDFDSSQSDFEADLSDVSSLLEIDDTVLTEVEDTYLTEAQALGDKDAFLEFFTLTELPTIPTGTRPMDALLQSTDCWGFSYEERTRLADWLGRRAKNDIDEEALEEFQSLTRRHEDARKRQDEARDNIRVALLNKVKLLGSTTTGAAKLPAVLKGFAPKVLVIEEAGQVLEAHVLATLFPSIEHVIAIGDPLQLRPNVNCYELSVDSSIGEKLYRFDVSLMERLASGGLPMSQLLVQRRMRPTISSLIRNTLYPRLMDHELVTQYPDVRGMGKNVFFLDHRNPESKGGDEGASKSNDYEVSMACDLALYFLKQGSYTREGDIVILVKLMCRQLMKMKQALAGRHITVIMDERDQREIDRRVGEEEDSEPEVKQVAVAHQVLLRTVDNFQGEEAKIVILSLVRNAGEADSLTPQTIGFLKSNNRANVALSRAKHGLYIMGNAPQLAARSPMWETIIGELSEGDCMGNGWPIACARHPETLRYAFQPGQIQQLSPDGGSTCHSKNMPMPCGHLCRQKCHPDDLEHRLIECRSSCTRLLSCGHPCQKRCYEDCGKCELPCKNVELPCGHIVDLLCWETRSLDHVKCHEMVSKKFASCEYDIPKFYPCKAICGTPTDCCGRNCKADCSTCQSLNKDLPRPKLSHGPIVNLAGEPQEPFEDITHQHILRLKHASHPCGKILDICKHACKGDCSTNHAHPPCKEPCLQSCSHQRCRGTCQRPCNPCELPCMWRCAHGKQCHLPCSMPCDRVPCEEHCTSLLTCGHPCPSICGEPCSLQVCPQCADADQLDSIVDVIMQSTLSMLLDEDEMPRLITLTCGHVFTVESLDGVAGLGDHYSTDPRSGEYTMPKLPEPGFKERPLCPNCRGPISSPRYNRVTKRALIDIQEQHAITNAARDVSRLRQSVANIDLVQMCQSVTQTMNGVNINKNIERPNMQLINLQMCLAPDAMNCVPSNIFFEEISKYFSITGPIAVAWKKTVEGPMLLYRNLARMVNNARLPHVAAYEAALTSAFHEEMELSTSESPNTATIRDATQSAMLTARRRVGAPFPRGEARFKIEALLESIKVRLKLAPVAKSFADAIGRVSLPDGTSRHRQNLARNRNDCQWRFGVLSLTLLRSARRDASLAIRLCEEAETCRLTLSSALIVLETSFQMGRFHAEEYVSRSIWKNPTVRQEATEQAVQARQAAGDKFIEVYNDMVDGERGNDQLREWAKEKVWPMYMTIMKEWSTFVETLRTGVFYSPVSSEEKLQIARAVIEASWQYGGRFYQCPRGHTFTIGECGQAMEEANCPDCGERIGGAHHQLLETNRRDQEMEDLATSAGAERNPHVND
ncbi:hypothetical protein M231_04338 [Tremella mesenterica]|uniref:RZ-type domain-containing protein n=1 Tax=Tremella mesenterica TaxID=5217 RepID=A0A4Q1BKY1_TREME|nr:hypothetical protein M231_04338 [Tremella mesenterica]